MGEPTDEALIEAYTSAADVGALNQLIERHIGFVRGVLVGLSPDPAETDDLTQETFLKAMRALPGFRRRAGFRTWLYRIAVNTARSRARRAGRVEYRAVLPDIPDAARTPAESAISTETCRRLSAVIDRLSPCLRRAFVLVGLEGVAPGEAARMEGCLAASMYRRVHTARRKLADWLQAEQGGAG
jgi:RNA polymerase sigma-70 factor, ECF subfamily